jgi:lysophospholipid acyltransferase (LPLAT)-like uncharacterized protein
LIRCLAFLGSILIRWWMGTIRYRLAYADDKVHPTDPRRERYLYAFWHESILFSARFRTRIHILVSQHGDGELIARTCLHLGKGTVRGSTTRGGGQALLDMAERSRRTHLAVTPDGPRGPRRRVQMGLILLASRTGLPIVAFGVGWSRAWRAGSWDRFAVPLPYSTAYAVAAPTIRVPPGLNRAGLEHYRRVVEERMLWATDAAERWAARRTGRQPESPVAEADSRAA